MVGTDSLLTVLLLCEVFPRFVTALFRGPKLSDSLSLQVSTFAMLSSPVLGMMNCGAGVACTGPKGQNKIGENG
jgi:hypothetical protein